jgi:hypothetical protein
LADLRAHLVPARDLEAREKRARLSTGSAGLDQALGGGWARGAISEIRGARGQGRTTVLLASLASTLQAGHAVALVDFGGTFDPGAAARAGVLLDRLLWVRAPTVAMPPQRRSPDRLLLSAAETIVSAGGFGLLALDFGERAPNIPSATWIRLRQLVTPAGTVVLVVVAHPVSSLFGATSLCLDRARPRFSEAAAPGASTRQPGPPLLSSIEAVVNLKATAGHDRGNGQQTVRLPLFHCPT